MNHRRFQPDRLYLPCFISQPHLSAEAFSITIICSAEIGSRSWISKKSQNSGVVYTSGFEATTEIYCSSSVLRSAATS